MQKDKDLFRIMLSKPEEMRFLIGRFSDPNDFPDVKYTRAYSARQAESFILKRNPGRVVIGIERVE